MMSLLIVAETRLECDALASAVTRDGRLAVVGCASSSREAAFLARRQDHDVVLIRMPLLVGLGVVRSLRAADPVARIVVMGVAADEREIRAWSEVGALGCVGGGASLMELCEVIAAVARGEVSCSSDVVGALFRRPIGRPVGDGVHQQRARLTRREVEVLGLLSSGLSNKQIAQTLSVEVSTVKNHTQNIFRKLGIHRRADTL